MFPEQSSAIDHTKILFSKSHLFYYFAKNVSIPIPKHLHGCISLQSQHSLFIQKKDTYIQCNEKGLVFVFQNLKKKKKKVMCFLNYMAKGTDT